MCQHSVFFRRCAKAMGIQTVLHIKPGGPIVAPPARKTVSVRGCMFLMNKDSRDPARATAEVFV